MSCKFVEGSPRTPSTILANFQDNGTSLTPPEPGARVGMDVGLEAGEVSSQLGYEGEVWRGAALSIGMANSYKGCNGYQPYLG